MIGGHGTTVSSYHFLDRIDLTAEAAEDAEEEKRGQWLKL